MFDTLKEHQADLGPSTIVMALYKLMWRDQDLLGLAVDLGDEVVAALFADRDAADAVEAAHDDFTGAARSADRNVEQGMHDLE